MKNFTIVLACVGLACVVLMAYLYNQNAEVKNDASEKPAVVERTVSSSAGYTRETDDGSGPSSNTHSEQAVIESQDGAESSEEALIKAMEKQAALNEQHGYFDDIEIKTYDGYSDETLRSLGDGGDVRALLKLSHRYARRLEFAQEADVLMEAAARGATSALVTRAISISSRLKAELYDEKAAREAVYDVLALCAVSSKMGNDIGHRDFLKGVVDDTNFVFTKENQEIVDRRAESIYDSLNKKRRELGLDPFEDEY
ncbi:hypothetical protein [Marinimicrobium agarilyticum]|uniref:hypothetical protein n=1 Tax=Marinimicrobium agarilyticum TaxID=306546 RepID=UPI000489951B|nr:hypothetical protein [Marinimicrobium agarilyticum]